MLFDAADGITLWPADRGDPARIPTERMPLSVMQDCLQVRPGSPDPRRAQAAGLLRSQRLGLFADGDASASRC